MSMWSRPIQQRTTLTDVGVSPRTPARSGTVHSSPDMALRHSAVWACLVTRADLISTFPIDVYRKIAGIDVEMPISPILVEPGGKHWDYTDWMWASQFEVDRGGNTIGVISEKNALGLPARIDLQPLSKCKVYQYRGMTEHRYLIDGTDYQAADIWHERQFPVPGLPVGLSPVAYAAWSLSEALTMQQFALDWFAGGAVPKAKLKNTEKALDADPRTNEARRVKDRYMATMANGEIFVHGKDWELDFVQAQSMGIEWLDGRRAAVADIARYFGCPLDLIEAAINAPGSITYQSALQRNLQFLVMKLGPAIVRREKRLSKLLPAPRYVKLNTAALLRMDPEQQATVIDTRIKNRTLTVSEGRQFYNQLPLTPEQHEEFNLLFGAPRVQPATASANASGWPDSLAPFEQVSPYSAVPVPYGNS